MKQRLSDAFGKANLVTLDRVQVLEERLKTLEEKVFGPQPPTGALLVEAAFPCDGSLPYFPEGGAPRAPHRTLPGDNRCHRRLRVR
jgi:hypothetical protein